MKKALITGITGQDGSYLAEHLLAGDYEVHGVIRRSSTNSTSRIDHLITDENKFFIHSGDVNSGIESIVLDVEPDVVFNLAAQSHVWVSFKEPVSTAMVNAMGVVKLLDVIAHAENKLDKQIRFFQASSSEMFGSTPPPQNEASEFLPVSPYGCAKVFAYWITRSYRASRNLFASNGILFNHESPRRGQNFVTKKITTAAARIKLGLQDNLELGNLDALRDWGHSKDYTRAMLMIMEHNEPDDFVVSSDEYYSVRDFLEKVFNYFELDWQKYVVIKDELKRPNEAPALLGDSSKIRSVLGWIPQYNFEELVQEMCVEDYRLALLEYNQA